MLAIAGALARAHPPPRRGPRRSGGSGRGCRASANRTASKSEPITTATRRPGARRKLRSSGHARAGDRGSSEPGAPGGDDGGAGEMWRLDARGLEDLAGGAERARHPGGIRLEVVEASGRATRTPPPHLAAENRLGRWSSDPRSSQTSTPRNWVNPRQGREAERRPPAPDQAEQGRAGRARRREAPPRRRPRAGEHPQTAAEGASHLSRPASMRPSRRRITRSAEESDLVVVGDDDEGRPSR